MAERKRKRRTSAQIRKDAVVTDGCNPEFIEGARWSGTLEIPIIEKPERIAIPKGFVPFSEMVRVVPERFAVCEYENDRDFADLLRNPEPYVKELRKFQAFVTPDASLYWETMVRKTDRNRWSVVGESAL